MTDLTLGVVLASAEPGRVHAALSMAASGAAVGRRVVLLATGAGCRALHAADAFDGAYEARLAAAGVATCAALRDALEELGAGLMACEASLRLHPGPLCGGASASGMATFLIAAGAGPIVSF